MSYKVYVDGSYNQNSGYYGWAYIVYKNNQIIKQSYGQDNIASDIWQVAGELSATMRSVEYCYENYINNICVYYDYKGIEEWVTGGWKTKNKWTKMYKEFMLDYMQDMNITFKKVKAHSNDICNTFVDKLAKEGCKIC